MAGESGEVFNEVHLVDENFKTFKNGNALQGAFTNTAILVDNFKKQIRKGEMHVVKSVIIDEMNFDEELADTLYYLNILAMNRGYTLNHYAQMAIDKVQRKGLNHEPAKK